jgi:hypothetical protein
MDKKVCHRIKMKNKELETVTVTNTTQRHQIKEHLQHTTKQTKKHRAFFYDIHGDPQDHRDLQM